MYIMGKRKFYQPPVVKAVAFKVEEGYQASVDPGLGFALVAGEFGAAHNSGSGFWGGSEGGCAAAGTFGSSGFDWDGSSGGQGSAATFSGYEWSW